MEGSLDPPPGKSSEHRFLSGSVGCTGSGFGIHAGLIAYRSMVRPIMEYGMALVPGSEGKNLEIPRKTHQQALATLSGLGKRVLGNAVGDATHQDAPPAVAGQVACKSVLRNQGQSSALCLEKGRETVSPTLQLRSPEARLWVRQRYHPAVVLLGLPAVESFFQARTPTTFKAPERKVFTEWHGEALQEWMPMPSWSLFRRDHAGRRIFRLAFFRLNRTQQRVILLWFFGVATGSQKVCTRAGCENADATKEHLEAVHLPATETGDRKEALLDARLLSLHDIERTFALIMDLIGTRPGQFSRIREVSKRIPEIFLDFDWLLDPGSIVWTFGL